MHTEYVENQGGSSEKQVKKDDIFLHILAQASFVHVVVNVSHTIRFIRDIFISAIEI